MYRVTVLFWSLHCHAARRDLVWAHQNMMLVYDKLHPISCRHRWGADARCCMLKSLKLGCLTFSESQQLRRRRCNRAIRCFRANRYHSAGISCCALLFARFFVQNAVNAVRMAQRGVPTSLADVGYDALPEDSLDWLQVCAFHQSITSMCLF